MLIFGRVDAFTKVTKPLNTFNSWISKQTVGDKVHSQKGNSPEYELRSLKKIKYKWGVSGKTMKHRR